MYKKKNNSAIFASIIIIIFIILSAKIPLSICQLLPQEYMNIAIEDDGSICITIYCLAKVKAVPIEFIDEDLWGIVVILENGIVKVSVSYLVPNNNFQEVKSKIYKWAEFFQEALGGSKLELLREDKRTTLDPKTHSKTINMLDMEFRIICNPESLVQLFLSWKPNDGFLKIIDRKSIEPNKDKIQISIYGIYSIGKYGLMHDDKIYVKFYFSKIFPKYFKYKYGESYILDVSSLFNYSEPIVTFSKSISTCIEIKLDIPSFASFEILEINPKKLNVYRERKEGMITGYWITNLPPGKPFIGGEVLDRIYVKFKVIQAGTTIPFGGIKLIGGIMVSLVFLIASIFVYFMYRKMIVKT